MAGGLVGVLGVVGFLGGLDAGAASFEWTGGGADDSWGEAANWSPLPVLGFDAGSELLIEDVAETRLLGDLVVGDVLLDWAAVRNSTGDASADPGAAFKLEVVGGDFWLANRASLGILENARPTVLDGVVGGPALRVDGGDVLVDSGVAGSTGGRAVLVMHSLPAVSGPGGGLGGGSAAAAWVEVTTGQVWVSVRDTWSGNGRVSFGALPGVNRRYVNDGLLSVGYAGPALLGGALPATALRIEGSGEALDFGTVDLDGILDTGMVEVRANALLDVAMPLSDAFGGTATLADGAVLRMGAAWELDGELAVLSNGATGRLEGGALRVSGGGRLAVALGGALEVGTDLTVDAAGQLVSGGQVRSDAGALVTVLDGGTLGLTSTSSATRAGALDGGLVVAEGGRVNVTGELRTGGASRLEQGATLTFGSALFGGAETRWSVADALVFEPGVSTLGSGRLSVEAGGAFLLAGTDFSLGSAGSRLFWEGSVDNAGRLTLENPALSSVTEDVFIGGDFAQVSGGTLSLRFERVGGGAEAELSEIVVDESVALAGTLELVGLGMATGGGFGSGSMELPSDGATFTLIASLAGEVSGTFEALTLLDLPGISAQLTYFSDRVDVTFSRAFVAGDFDASGSVEQGDLDLVLGNWGVDTAAAGVPSGWVNTAGLLGAVDQAELDAVLANWGSASGVPSFAGSALPEPGVAGLAMAGGLGMARRRRRRRA